MIGAFTFTLLATVSALLPERNNVPFRVRTPLLTASPNVMADPSRTLFASVLSMPLLDISTPPFSVTRPEPNAVSDPTRTLPAPIVNPPAKVLLPKRVRLLVPVLSREPD